VKVPAIPLAALCLCGCAASPPSHNGDVQEFLRMYNLLDQRLYTVAAEASWKASTDVTEEHTGERIGADSALAAFRGSPYIIETSRRFLDTRKDSISNLEFRQLDKILLNAAESPGTIPDVVRRRVQAEARLSAILDGFTFCLERKGEECAKPITPNAIDEALRTSRDLAERKRIWEVSKQSGPALKQGLAELRDLRNQVARQLGYSSYFHLQVADYGMTVAEMMKLMDETVASVQPLYDQLHHFARRNLAERYQQGVPEKIPAHWLANRWGQQWPGLVEAADLDPLLRKQPPEWILRQAERFYVSLGMEPLPESFWSKSDLYQLPPGAKRRKNTHASAWHIDRDKDVRSLMSVVSNFRWFETAHHELGHVYYYLAYSNPEVPHVLREGLNRSFHETFGDLIGLAARQESYLRAIQLLPPGRQLDQRQLLLSEALDNAIVFIPFAAGVMTHFEYELYEKDLPVSQFNRRWWDLVAKYQGIVPPEPRGEQFCDACTKTHIIDDPAQYYDYALASLLKFQLHRYIARNILKQELHNANYYGSRAAGGWLMGILRLGATRDWRHVLRETTGEQIGPAALLEYFQPLEAVLSENPAAAAPRLSGQYPAARALH
jgi:peptidyl-dipeptidase A